MNLTNRSSIYLHVYRKTYWRLVDLCSFIMIEKIIPEVLVQVILHHVCWPVDEIVIGLYVLFCISNIWFMEVLIFTSASLIDSFDSLVHEVKVIVSKSTEILDFSICLTFESAIL